MNKYLGHDNVENHHPIPLPEYDFNGMLLI